MERKVSFSALINRVSKRPIELDDDDESGHKEQSKSKIAEDRESAVISRQRSNYSGLLRQCMQRPLPVKESESSKLARPCANSTSYELQNPAVEIARLRVFNGTLEKHGSNITAREIRQLLDGRWLNDEVVNAYIQMVIFQMHKNEEIGYVTSLVFATLKGQDASQIPSITRAEMSKKTVLFAANVHNRHWVLLQADRSKRIVRLFDSSPAGESFEARTALNDAVKLLQHVDRTTQFATEVSSDNPKQTDGSACGVYVCLTARSIIESGFSPRGFSAEFWAGVAHKMRFKIASDLVQTS